MANIITTDIIVVNTKDRLRKQVSSEKIEELADSIAKLGLMHAIVVQNDGQTLVAGFRRLQALKMLHEQQTPVKYQGRELAVNEIPVVPLADLTDKEYTEAELDENIRRVQLTWQERSCAVRELYETRGAVNADYTMKDATEELYDEPEPKHYKDIEKDLTVAAFLDDEEVTRAKDRDEALKIIAKKMQTNYRTAYGKQYDLENMNSEHKLLRGDAKEILGTLETASFDCIIADPPYGVDADKWGSLEIRGHSYLDSESYSNHMIQMIATQGHRLTKPSAHLYMFCSFHRFNYTKQVLTESGWEVFTTPLIWYRGHVMGISPWNTLGPRRTYECIVFAAKGKRQMVKPAPADVIMADHERNVDYGANKPPKLYEELISRSCLPGDTVLDPCCGSGPVFPAATATKTIATGIEINDEAIAFCVERMKQHG